MLDDSIFPQYSHFNLVFELNAGPTNFFPLVLTCCVGDFAAYVVFAPSSIKFLVFAETTIIQILRIDTFK